MAKPTAAERAAKAAASTNPQRTKPNTRPAPASRVEPVRITVDLDPELHRRLKIHCATEGTRISEVIRDLLETRV